MSATHTVLVASVPIPAHTHNATPFVARLVAQGHRVLWYADRAFHAHVRSTGAEPITPSGESRAAVERLVRFDGLGDIRRAFREFFVGDAPARYADLRAVLERESVDVLLTDSLAYGAGLAAEAAGVPWASFGDGPLHYPDRQTPPFGTGLPVVAGWPWDLRNIVVASVSRHVVFGRAERDYRRLRRSSGVGGDALGSAAGPVLEANLSPYLHLHGATPSFEYPRRDLPRHVHWVGVLRPEVPPAWRPPAWWDRVTAAGAPPLVVVSQGTIRDDVHELFVPAVRALAGRDVTVLVTTGRARPADVEAALGGAVPENVVLEQFVPYDAVLAHADAFVTNGGWTGVTLALAHGVPLVQVGSTEEKADIGARIAYSGAGVRLRRRHASPEWLSGAVARVLGDSPQRAAARRIQAEMAGYDAGSLGADLLLILARTGRPVLRELPATSGDRGTSARPAA